MTAAMLAFMPSMGLPELILIAILGLTILVAIAVVLISVWAGTRNCNSPEVPPPLSPAIPPVPNSNDDLPSGDQAT